MILKLRFLALLVVIIACVLIATYYLLSMKTTTTVSSSNINSEFISIVDNNCTSCSADTSYLVYSLLASQGYSNTQAQISFGNSEANSFIENNSVTSLPSVVLPQSEESANLLNALIYLNIFNLEGNNFVLNTPFLSGLIDGVTYFNIIQNRTIKAYDIYNVSRVYNISPQSKSASYINPMELIDQFNASDIKNGNKTAIILVYSGSPFSAIESFVLKDALESFGAFSQIVTSTSNTVQASSTQFIGPEAMYELGSMGFSSSSFVLDAENLSLPLDTQTEKELFNYDQNAGSLNSLYGSFTPFLDIGGKYISVSSMLDPVLFNDMNLTQMTNKITANSSVSSLFNDSVSFVDAVLCSYVNYTNNVCKTSAVKAQESNINKQI